MLHWNREFGDRLEHWERTIFSGGRAPDTFYERPEIDDVSAYIWQAFIDLGTERQIGMGLGPIPRSAAQAYAREQYDLTGDGFDRFWSIISQVDNEYLRLANASDKDSDQEPDSDGKRPKVSAKPISRTPASQ